MTRDVRDNKQKIALYSNLRTNDVQTLTFVCRARELFATLLRRIMFAIVSNTKATPMFATNVK